MKLLRCAFVVVVGCLASRTEGQEGLVRDLTVRRNAYVGILQSLSLPDETKAGSIVRKKANILEFGRRDRIDFWVNDEPLSWSDAESACEKSGGQLATINQDVMEATVVNRLVEGNVWIGHRDGRVLKGVENPVDITFVAEAQCGVVREKLRELGANGFGANAENCATRLKSLCSKERTAREVNKDALYHSRFFVVEGQGLTWNSAKAECERRGARLATVRGGEIILSPTRRALTTIIANDRINEQGDLEAILQLLMSYPNSPAFVGMYTDAFGQVRQIDNVTPYKGLDTGFVGVGPRSKCLYFDVKRSLRPVVADTKFADCDAVVNSGEAITPIAVCESKGNHLWTKRGTYWLSQDASSFVDAKAKCSQAGGSLASISNADEQAVVLALTGKAPQDVWVGIEKTSSNPPSAWLDGTSLSFQNWAPGAATAPVSDFKTSCNWRRVLTKDKFHFRGQVANCTTQDSGVGGFFDLPLETRAFRYLVDGMPVVYYRRYTDSRPGTQAERDAFIPKFTPALNDPTKDFALFSTEEDMHNKVNAWQAVVLNANDTGGFPMQSGPFKETEPELSLDHARCDKSSAFEFCDARQAGCGVFSPSTGEWSFESCFKKKSFVCFQKDFFQDLPESTSEVITTVESATDTFWSATNLRSFQASKAFCEANAGGHLARLKTIYQWFESTSVMTGAVGGEFFVGLERKPDAPIWTWEDGDKVFELWQAVGDSSSSPFVVKKTDAIQWREISKVSEPSQLARPLCSRERHGPRSGNEFSFEKDGNALTGAAHLAYLPDGKLLVGNTEYGELQVFDPLTGLTNSLHDGTPRLSSSRSPQSCESFGVEPHRFYCLQSKICLEEDCQHFFNHPGRSYGPTAIAVHPVSGEIFVAVQKIGKGVFYNVDTDYIGSLIFKLRVQDGGQFTSELVIGGGASKPSVTKGVAFSSAKLEWVNAIAFESDGKGLYVSDRDARSVFWLNEESGVVSMLAGVNGAVLRSTFVNSALPKEGLVQDAEVEIGVPQYLVVSKTTDRRVYVASLVQNDAKFENQRYHILQIDRVDKSTDAILSFPLKQRVASLSGVVATDQLASFTQAITGLEIDSQDVLYIAQRETGSIFSVDLSKPPSEGKLSRMDIKTVDRKRRDHHVRANSIVLDPAESSLILGSMYEYGVQPLRVAHLPLRENSPSALLDDATGDCKHTLAVADFFVYFSTVLSMLSKETVDLKAIQDLIAQGQVCTNDFVTGMRARSIAPTIPERQMIQELQDILDKLWQTKEGLPDSSKADAAYMRVVWNWYVAGSATNYRTMFPPPPPQPPSGMADPDALTLELYMAMVDTGSSTGLVATCREAVKSANLCECGSVFHEGACEKIGTSRELPNFYAVAAYCAFGEAMGAVEDEFTQFLSAPLLFWVGECVQQDLWKSGFQATNLALLDVLSQVVETGSTYLRSLESVETKKDFSAFVQDVVVGSKAKMSADVSLMRMFDAVSLTRLDSDCLVKGCAKNLEALAADLSLQLENFTVPVNALLVANKTTEAVDDLLESVLNLRNISVDKDAETFSQLADLALNLPTAVENGNLQVRSFVDFVHSQIVQESSRINQLGSDLGEYRTNLQDHVQRLIEEAGQVTTTLQSMKKGADALLPVVKEYYECKNAPELAKLASVRVLALFEVVLGSFQMGVETGKLLGSGSASSTATEAVAGSLKGVQGINAARSLIRTSSTKFNTKYRTTRKPRPTRATRPTTTDAVKTNPVFLDLVETLGMTNGSYTRLLDSAAALIIDTSLDAPPPGVDTLVGFLVGAFNVLEEPGIPGADEMSTILGGLQMLVKYDESDEVEKGYAENMESSRLAFDKLAEIAGEIGEFFTKFALEFYQMLKGQIPDVSVAESVSSTSLWDSLEMEFIAFLRRSDMFVDIEKAAGRRLLSWKEVQEGKGEASLGSKLRWRKLNKVVGTSPFGRVLSGKGECTNPVLGELASTGMEIFEQYLLDITRAVSLCKELHMRMISTLQALRKVRTVTVAVNGGTTSQGRLEASRLKLEQLIPATAPTPLSALQDVVISLKRKAPSVALRRDPSAFEAMRFFQQGTLAKTCAAAWYADLAPLSGCSLSSDVLADDASGSQFESVKRVVKSVQDNFRKETETSSRREDWFRVPVATALEIKSQLGAVDKVNAGEEFVFDLYQLPEEFVGCGYNMEIRHKTFLMEQPKDVDVAHVSAFEGGFVDMETNEQGPFVKVDGSRRRHLFHIGSLSATDKSQVRVVRDGSADYENCGSPTFEVEEFPLRDRIKTKVCVEKVKADRDPLPLLGVHRIVFSPSMAALISEGSDDQQLVMYVKLAVTEVEESCKANAFRFLTNDPETSSPQEEGSNLGLIIGLTVGTVILVGLAVLTFVKREKAREVFSNVKRRIFSRNAPIDNTSSLALKLQ